MSRGYKPNNPLLIKGTVVVVIVVVVAILAFMGSGGLYQLEAVTVKRASTTVETSAIDVATCLIHAGTNSSRNGS